MDAVLMGGFYLPSDSFAMVVEYLDHGTAVRSTPSSKSWWRTSECVCDEFNCRKFTATIIPRKTAALTAVILL